MSAVVFALAYFGFACLAPHRRRTPFTRQMIGAAALFFALAGSIAERGWSIGFLVWFGILTIAALAVALTLTYAPRLVGHHR